MLLKNAFMTQRQLQARGLPMRASSGGLSRIARTALALVYGIELLLLFCAGSAHGVAGVAAGIAGLLACHVAVYAIESHPASAKQRVARA